MLTVAVIAAAAAGDGQLIIAIGAVATLVGVISGVVMLGPNRRGKAMENAKEEVHFAWESTDRCREDLAQATRRITTLEAQLEASERARKLSDEDRGRLIAKLMELGVDLDDA